MKILKNKGLLLVGLCVLAVSLAGCGKSEKKAEETEVIKIGITPEVTPTSTPIPEEINSAAIVTNGNMTMVNEYIKNGENK